MNISKRRWFLSGVIAFSILSPGSIWANSKFLNVQGALTDTAGNPLAGSKTVTFRLYTSSTAAVASAIWTESQAVILSTGLFNVALGTATALDSLSFDRLYYLGIQVAGDGNELAPRQQLGASAYAQGSLGAFTVGGNLVVDSSMTVSGNAFSVGGSTLAVVGGSVGVGTNAPAANLDVNGNAQFGRDATKSTFTSAGNLLLPGSVSASSITLIASGAGIYSITTSSSIHILGGGIAWADGTTSTTASPSATGAQLNTTQTFTAPNTFVSSVTIGPTIYSSTASKTGGYFINGWMMVASTAPSGSNGIYFYNLQPNRRYRMSWALSMVAGGGQPLLRFNGDSTSPHYRWNQAGLDTNVVLVNNGSNGTTYCEVESGSDGMANSSPTRGYMEFATVAGNTVVGEGRSSFIRGSGSLWTTLTTSCQWAGTSPISSLSWTNASAGMVGVVQLEMLGAILP